MHFQFYFYTQTQRGRIKGKVFADSTAPRQREKRGKERKYEKVGHVVLLVSDIVPISTQ